ncbi:phosphoribosylglycinamide formyltransferase [Criibacterium bergeronii]|uniref:Phosphoribosylglycinamide formyltransferase n=1 Tax=Criibacterium bergeronii TaxID=1871336 RepID=A0A371IN95_9FIRM|nr:phosphoribosylglycinamide formyltransferase [Criibacterium bergeronii]RDY21896.1 phosphoribosylglycinamide formyltransferase [Criibacterium bergeronii]
MRKDKINVAVLVSGGGTNLQAIIDAEKSGIIHSAKIALVISNNPNAYAIQRAKDASIDTYVVSKKDYTSQEDYENAMIEIIKKYEIGLIVLAGFMVILGNNFIKKFENRIINVHPSLIPSFCGDGFFGLKVHEAALKKGVKVTGATVHYVTTDVDAGPIIAQKAVQVFDNDTPEILQQRVMKEAEHIILPNSIQNISEEMVKNV